MPSEVIHLIVNGESREAPSDASLLQLLERFGLDPRLVVVELNRQIVRRPALAGTRVRDGDHIELVHFVGGG